MTEYEADAAIVAATKFTPLDFSEFPQLGFWDAEGKSGAEYTIRVCDDGTFSLDAETRDKIPTFGTLNEAMMRANRIEADRQAGREVE